VLVDGADERGEVVHMARDTYRTAPIAHSPDRSNGQLGRDAS
jgi:hypothetical protein